MSKKQSNFVFTRRTPGISKVLSHLRAHKDGITPLEALGVYGIYRLGSAIHILRKISSFFTPIFSNPNLI